MKEIIREAVERRMPNKESIRINAMQENKMSVPKKVYAVLAVVMILAVSTCFAVPMMINEPDIPSVPIETTTRQEDTTLSGSVSDTAIDDTTDRTTLSTTPNFPWDQIDEPEEGIYIPAIELEPPESGVAADIIGFVVYGGKVYTQAEYIWCDREEKEKYRGAYLGTAKGNYDCGCIEIPEEEYEPIDMAGDFTSNVTGDVYTVNGYNPAFRICIPNMYAGCDFIAFFECLDDITLATGEDLYGEQRLNIKENYSKVYSHCNAYLFANAEDNTEPTALSDEAMTMFQKFIDKLLVSEFTEYRPDGILYKREHIILYIEMKDGSTAELCLFSDGYVKYSYMRNYVMVKVKDEVFNDFYDMLK